MANMSRNIESDENNQMEAVSRDTFNGNAGVWFNKFNRDFKDSSTVKLLVFGVQKNQVMIRVSNMEDRFDGLNAKSFKFDINAWAREFYIEANSHFLMKNTTSEIIRGIRLEIQEMNLAGSVPKSIFNTTTMAKANWMAMGQVDADSAESMQKEAKKDSESSIEKEPKDNI